MKKKKVTLNVLVTGETRDAIKMLAEQLECSQGMVVDSGVSVLADRVDGGPRSAIPPPRIMYDPLLTEGGGVDGRSEGAVKGFVLAAERSSPTEIPGVTQGLPAEPKSAHCQHCGQDFAGRRFDRICRVCTGDGHVNASPCRRCAQDAHAKEMAVNSTSCDPSTIDFNPYEPA